MLAAGEGRRTGHHTNKVLLPLAGRRVFTWSIRWARVLPFVSRTMLVIREEDREDVLAALDREVEPPAIDIVVGGDSRHASEWQALQALAPAILADELDVVVIHDAARPLASTELFATVIATAVQHGGAIPVREQGNLAAYDGADPPTDRVVAVQTPQAFLARPLLEAYRQAAAEGFVGTDTASCMERYTDLPVHCVPGDARNLKITFPDDLFLAERVLAKTGFDLSSGLEPGRRTHLGLPHLRDLWPSGRRR
jgi:2-C-methyl-D-erythritol 4-phosphate cytidylyltransferase